METSRPEVSIGHLARESGIPVETLRTWERRYGSPAAGRLPSGHRRYPREEIHRLRIVAEAVALGERPARALRAPEPELRAWVEAARGGEARLDGAWEEVLRTFDETAAGALLEREWRARSAPEFAGGVLGPLLRSVGSAWARGGLEIRREHFLSSCLGPLLRSLRARKPPPPGAPVVLFATLPGERHALGVEIAALVAADAGARSVVLGADSPPEEIAAAAFETRAALVALGVSSSSAGPDSDRRIRELRDALPPRVPLVIGGAGARRRRRRRGVAFEEDFARFAELVRGLRAPAAGEGP